MRFLLAGRILSRLTPESRIRDVLIVEIVERSRFAATREDRPMPSKSRHSTSLIRISDTIAL